MKLTVNFDDPETYHLYSGNYSGRPGTILTFFPWKGVPRGWTGAGQMTVTAFAVPTGSLDYWKHRLTSTGVDVEGPDPLFADQVIAFRDYDGMRVEFGHPRFAQRPARGGAALLSPRGKSLENGMNRFFRRLAMGVLDIEHLKFR